MNFNLTLLGQTISMIVFVAIATKIWPMLIAKIDERRKNIADGIAAGEKGQRELADARQGAEGILQEARQKATQVADLAHKRSGELIAEAKQVAIAEGERLIASARTELTTSMQEHRIYPQAIGDVLSGGWSVEGRRFVRAATAEPTSAWRLPVGS